MKTFIQRKILPALAALISLASLLLSAPAVHADTLINSTFEGSLGSWTAATGASLYTFSSGTNYASTGTGAANLPKSSGAITLTSALPLATNGYTSLTISFKHKWLNGQTTRFLYVQYAADGVNFGNLAYVSSGNTTQPATVTLNVGAAAANQVTVTNMTENSAGYAGAAFTNTAKFRFINVASATADVRAYIDDIVITATPNSAPPTITGAATATAFTTTYGTPSAAQTFAVGGANLTANLIASAPTGFEVSSNGTTYASTATFTQSGGTATGSLRIRLAATAPVAGTYDGLNIVLSSTGATSVNITTAASGNTVSKGTPVLTVGNTPVVYDGSPKSATISSVPGTASNILTGGAADQTNAGTYAVTADFVPTDTDNYNSLTAASAGDFVIEKANQTISFTLASPVDRSVGTVALPVSSSSGLTISYASSDPLIASTSGSTLTLIQGGSITVTASQGGNINYNPATSVPQALVITGFTAVADAATRPTNSADIKIPVATLLANDGAVGGGGAVTPGSGLTLTGVTAGTGNTVAFDATWVYYTPSNPADSAPLTFTYTSSDGSNSATATVTVTTENATAFNLDILRVVTPAAYNSGTNETSVTVEFAGVPNQTYQIAYSTDLSNWSTPAGYPTGVTGTFNATFTKTGDVAAVWGSSLFFRATR